MNEYEGRKKRYETKQNFVVIEKRERECNIASRQIYKFKRS